MKLTTLFLLSFNVPLVVMYHHQKPVAEKVWSERCIRNTVALNDCNWCHCNANSAYVCKARVCSEVDMFGHFNDAIRDMDVGMEGHGVWRSVDGACQPGVHYLNNELLCVCTEDGKWPNPVCRDIFQVLHSVEVTNYQEPASNHTCSASKLYLYGCNVCFCPSTERIDPKLCTKRICVKENVGRTSTKALVEEVYATCTPTKNYRLGCQTCVCLRNNRLLCDNCTVSENQNTMIVQNTVCNGTKPGVIFRQNCNYCRCDRKDTIYCSAKKCLPKHTHIYLPKYGYELVDEIQDYYNCLPGTKYNKDCNTCHCFLLDGVKYFGCSLEPCKRDLSNSKTGTCIEGTSYQVNCLICHCVVEKNVKREFCTIDETCKLEEKGTLRALSSMHGYCEPMHFYQQDCNKCRCLTDGKTVACTSKLCYKKKYKNKNKPLTEMPVLYQRFTPKPSPTTTEKAIIMEFVPFVQKDNYCPRGQMYRVDCNLCYCMPNGNAICTTKQC